LLSANGFRSFGNQFTSGNADISYVAVDDPDNSTEPNTARVRSPRGHRTRFGATPSKVRPTTAQK